MAAYANYAAGAAKILRDSINSSASDSQIESEIKEMIRFETELANVLFVFNFLFLFELNFF